MEVIPSIDLRGGRVVRLEQGDFARETEYGTDPVRVAARFSACRPPRIHLVDLDGALAGATAQLELVAAVIAAAAPVPIQAGGGIRDLPAVEKLFALGVDRVVIGTAAIASPELVRLAATAFPGRIVLALDARKGRVVVRGWQETSGASVEALLRSFGELPLAAVLHTDVSRDGMLSGPNVEATAQLARASPLPILASGGIGSIEDLLMLTRTRVIAGAVVGRALHNGNIDLADALAKVAEC